MTGYFPRSQLVGAHFGVVLVLGENGRKVEVATFRSEGPYSDGRRPDEVRFESDPALDAQRRDFTINGLMEDPLSGEIIDFVGGKAICKRKSFVLSAIRGSAFKRIIFACCAASGLRRVSVL